MWHHFWQYRTRWQAWDYPQRGHRRFIDLHAEAVNGGLLLPLHLGWWNFQSFNPPQIEPTYPEVMEQLGARMIGWDAGISITGGVDRNQLRNVPLFRRGVDILRTCEELRQARVFDESTKARLREPGQEYTLVQDASGKMRFRHSHAQPEIAAMNEPWTLNWKVTNRFSDQSLRFRLEALMSASDAKDTNVFLLADLAEAKDSSWQRTSAPGVRWELRPATKNGGIAVELSATNAGQVAQNGAWARLVKKYSPPVNLKKKEALRVEIAGDGSGAVVAIRLESPQHLAFGAIADHYVPIDFSGRRTFTLIETESSRWSDYLWNDAKSLYNVYRENIDFGAIESISVWLQNLAPHVETRIGIGPIHALPMSAVKLQNPRITINHQAIEFPVALAPGGWIQAQGLDDCEVFDAQGESLGKVKPRGNWPRLPAGSSSVGFACDGEEKYSARVRVTVFSQGGYY